MLTECSGVRGGFRLIIVLAVLPLTIRLAFAETTLTGQVLTPEGKPAANAVVKLYYFHDPTGYGSAWLSEAKADANSNFSIVKPDYKPPLIILCYSSAPGYYLLGAHPDHAQGITEFVPGKSAGYTIWLDHGRRITCTVTDAEGNAVKDAEVFPLLSLDNIVPMGRPALHSGSSPFLALQTVVSQGCAVKTGNDGIAKLPHGLRDLRALRFVKKGCGAGVAYVRKDGEADVQVQLMPDDLTLRGRVLSDETGTPLSNILVMAYFQGGASNIVAYFTRTDAQGGYQIAMNTATGEDAGRVIVALDISDAPRYAPSAIMLNEQERGEKVLDFRLVSGARRSGRVIDAERGAPLPGIPMYASAFFPEVRSYQFARLTGAAGDYDFRFANEQAGVVPRDPQGYSLELLPRPPDAVGEDYLVRLAPLERLRVTFRDPEGRPAPNCTVLAQQSEMVFGIPGCTDGNGSVEIVGFRRRMAGSLQIYGESQDSRAAVLADIPVEKLLDARETQLDLQPTQTVEFVMQDETGRDSPGWLFFSPQFAARGWTTLNRQVRVRPNAGVFAVRFQFIPGMTYYVDGIPEGLEEIDFSQFEDRLWSYNAAGPAPRQILRFKSQARASAQAAFQMELTKLKDALWSKEDPIQKDLTWYALQDGFAFADSERKEVKRFAELLGERRWLVSGMAFGTQKVWLGTDKGLLAWDRKDRFWSRFAVGGLLVDEPAKDLLLTDAGILKVTVEEQGKPQRTFEYDTQTAKWTELK